MLKLYLDYGNNPTIDLSDKILSISNLTRRIESAKPGEAGVMVFDNVSLELPLSAFPNDEMSFENLDANPDYIFTIAVVIGGTEYKLFEGMLDKSTVEHTKAKTAKFDVLDKLSALKLLENEIMRNKFNVWDRITNSNIDYLYVKTYPLGSNTDPSGLNAELNVIAYDNGTPVDLNDLLFFEDEFIIDPDNSLNYSLVRTDSQFYLDGTYGVQGVKCIIYNYINLDKVIYRNNPWYYYEKFFGGHDILIHGDVFGQNGITAYDARKISYEIIKKKWPSSVISPKSNINEIPISMMYYQDTIDRLFDRDYWLQGLIEIFQSARMYFTFTVKNELVYRKQTTIQDGFDIDLNNYEALDYTLNYMWDKKVDQVQVNNINDAVNPSDTYGEYPTNLKYPARNILKRDIFLLDESESTAAIAQEYYNFYSVRRKHLKLKLKLNAVTAGLELADRVRWDNDNWFVIGLDFDLINMKVDLELVEI